MSACCSGGCTPPAPMAVDGRYRRILMVAFAINLTMFFVEIVSGWLARSTALQADALDFFGDAANYGISLFVLASGVRVRAGAALFKGGTMAIFGLWVMGSTAWHAWSGTLPRAEIMGGIGLLALAANGTVTALLYAYRQGDANMRSVWLCSRNDSIANIAVIIAASGVFVTATHWPDIAVAAIIGGLNLSGAVQVIRRARQEWRAAAGGAD
ncbi:cation transporter [Magnetospirillum gryphiswaldense]|uniref:Cation efflux protein n=1 Tax=Magnetospirillum gryphiswaldense TaxID=55518 RepID=A4TX41_9PROT|nr:cation transporter [Magnetospirillum gryphiswaldense]AVM73096.1 Cation efflux family protein [Magnetospirillum gryphiswaldense MSR-1]AVM76999.1 Cation efflux family protein [Magnetospirillum gryphiswaldense]CAM75198.1 Cation efflux protein [Magnetospirillum gryphiswaldense MSR-1]